MPSARCGRRAIMPNGTGPWASAFSTTWPSARSTPGELGLERAAIVDWDVHHGNGTQHLFEATPRSSIPRSTKTPIFLPRHRHPRETGQGPGQGFTRQPPLPAPERGRESIRKPSKKRPCLVLQKFAPRFLFISAGFDAHQNDPRPHMNLSRDAYRQMARTSPWSWPRRPWPDGLITVLEGGYNLEILEECTEDHVRLLLGIPRGPFLKPISKPVLGPRLFN